MFDTIIIDDDSFIRTARTFYDNSECNSHEEFSQDIARLVLIGNHFNRYDSQKMTNFPLLINHFVSFVNCFGIVSESLLKYRLSEHIRKINSLFVFIGHKKFDGTVEIDEKFFLHLTEGL